MTSMEINEIALKTAEYLKRSIMDDPEMLDYVFPTEYLDIDEASKYTKIAKSTLYSKIKDIPHRKHGKRLVFSKRALAKFIATSCWQ